MPAGKMTLAHGRSQSGGYHYFRPPVARQLQRFVRPRVDSELAREARERAHVAGPCLDPAPGQREEPSPSPKSRAAKHRTIPSRS